jgi:hypothetical protein
MLLFKIQYQLTYTNIGPAGNFLNAMLRPLRNLCPGSYRGCVGKNV